MNEHVSVPSPVGEDYLLLGQYAERAYLKYAMSVVKGRALPEVSDGLMMSGGYLHAHQRNQQRY